MALLPGWDRGRLLTADPRDVEAARIVVYAQARAPLIRQDIDGQIEALEASIRQAEASGLSADQARLEASREAGRSADRMKRHVADLREAKELQAAVRELLELDAPDEPADSVEAIV